MTDWAAALTYYGLLSLFPALIALVSVLGLFGDPQETTKTITDVVTQIGPSSAADTFSGPIQSITQNQSRRRNPVRRRAPGGAVVGVRLHRRLHAGLEHHLGDA